MIIRGNRSFIDGNKIYDTAIVGVLGNDFTAKDLTFRNNVGPIKHPEVMLRVEANLVLFYKCRCDWYQNTLYVKNKRQFYRDSEVYGTIDFICGDVTTLVPN
uniref:Pectinesterase catalytic domain-containing protein n=1 Tax=Solanum lycopersicum TaxID=4081 RepID=A0A3Q7IGM9_SOLLC